MFRPTEHTQQGTYSVGKRNDRLSYSHVLAAILEGDDIGDDNKNPAISSVREKCWPSWTNDHAHSY